MNTAEKLGRIFCAAGATWILTSCSPDKPVPFDKTPVEKTVPLPIFPTASPKVDFTTEILNKLSNELGRLVQTTPADSLIRKVYLEDLNAISPIFSGKLPIGITEAAYARTNFGRAEYSPEHRFNYFLERDGSLAGYSTIRKMDVAISFSTVWLNSQSDAVKMLAVEKEAFQLALWEPFTRIISNSYLAQGRITKTDTTVTDWEIAQSLARVIAIQNYEVRKLYDYAGYLAVLPGVGKVLASEGPQAERELNYSSLLKIHQMAKTKRISFETLQFGSKEFLQTAFDPKGAWAKMISDPSIPGPELSNPNQ